MAVAASIKIEGLEQAMKALRAAFPDDAKTQYRVLNSTISAAARPTMLKTAKQLALQGDESGALSESLGLRYQSKSKIRAKRLAGGVEIVPVRHNKKAMALYIQHYYNAKGIAAPMKTITSGIRHGHLIEFGTKHHAARPFLWPAVRAQWGAFNARFASDLKKKIEQAVRRAARKRGKK